MAEVGLWEHVFWDCILLLAPFSSLLLPLPPSLCSLTSDLFKVTFCVWSHDLAPMTFNSTSSPNDTSTPDWNLRLKPAFFFLSCYLQVSQCLSLMNPKYPHLSLTLSGQVCLGHPVNFCYVLTVSFFPAGGQHCNLIMEDTYSYFYTMLTRLKQQQPILARE